MPGEQCFPAPVPELLVASSPRYWRGFQSAAEAVAQVLRAADVTMKISSPSLCGFHSLNLELFCAWRCCIWNCATISALGKGRKRSLSWRAAPLRCCLCAQARSGFCAGTRGFLANAKFLTHISPYHIGRCGWQQGLPEAMNGFVVGQLSLFYRDNVAAM